MSADELQAIKDNQRAIWTAGDYASIAEKIWAVGGRLVERLEPQPGEAMLDIACGTGNVTIRAAQTGASVTGLDLTPSLLETARGLASEAGVEIEFVEGDAESLPFDDASFDVVSSTFGCMFAPRHEVAAGEIARVLKPGGRIGICAWTPQGTIGQFFVTIASHLPPPSPLMQPPPLWGHIDHVREIFAGTGVELEFEEQTVVIELESVDAGVAAYETEFGPIVMARALLEPEGKYEALRDDLRALYTQINTATDGTLAWPAQYLVIEGRKA